MKNEEVADVNDDVAEVTQALRVAVRCWGLQGLGFRFGNSWPSTLSYLFGFWFSFRVEVIGFRIQYIV